MNASEVRGSLLKVAEDGDQVLALVVQAMDSLDGVIALATQVANEFHHELGSPHGAYRNALRLLENVVDSLNMGKEHAQRLASTV